MHFGTGNSRDMLCRAFRAARRDTHVPTSATCMQQRVQHSASAALTHQ